MRVKKEMLVVIKRCHNKMKKKINRQNNSSNPILLILIPVIFQNRNLGGKDLEMVISPKIMKEANKISKIILDGQKVTLMELMMMDS
jgi:hypothetical protein